ncbi:MAG: ATP phosphoribosyltransferase regulatory subunit, partial [Planctomycetes bacterium]|nr:ATP phosphoribosyltransferase regulatory subunit [Planctomycetota bacterium]
MAKISAPKGTRDFYPDDMRRRRYLEDTWRRVSLRAGFEEVDGPIFESLDLYIQKAGEEIVTQLYNFEDKGGRPIAIRPEFTQSLARMVVARQAALPKPIKWFNISRCCRYE